jgi:hypothetical protein
MENRMTTGSLPRRLRLGQVRALPVPSTPLLARALSRVDWSDAYALPVPGSSSVDAQEWADLIFDSPPRWIRRLFVVREVLIRLVGLERGGPHLFETVSWRPGEVLLGADQKHLGFRVSVLVEPDRVVVSSVVQVRNRRGRAYTTLVRRAHPFIVRGALARAGRRAAVSTCRDSLLPCPPSVTTFTQPKEKM